MKYIVKCHDCQSYYVTEGQEDPSTNAFEIDDIQCPECKSEVVEIVQEVVDNN